MYFFRGAGVPRLPIATIGRSWPATVAVALHHLTFSTFSLPAAIYPGGSRSRTGRGSRRHSGLMEACVLVWLADKLCRTCSRRPRGRRRRRRQASRRRGCAPMPSAPTTGQRARQERDGARRELASGFERTIGHIVEFVAVTAQEIQAAFDIHQRQQPGNGRANCRCRCRIDARIDQCRDGRCGHGRTDRFNRRDRQAGHAFGRNRRQGGRRGKTHQRRGRGIGERHPERSARW